MSRTATSMKDRMPGLAGTLALIGIFQVACTDSYQTGEDERAVRETLATFIQAFENGDLEVMEASFGESALTFPRAIMSGELQSPIRNSEYRRVRGIDPQMRMLIAGWHEGGSSAPFMSLEPKDLEVQMFTDAAVVSFHLEDGRALSRRTFVLAREEGSWKIIHLHASNVVSSE